MRPSDIRPIARFPDWRTRLVRYLCEVAHLPFEDGVHDCALFFAGALEAMTGFDVAAPYRGRYSTLRGGFRIVRRDGYRDHVAWVQSHLETKPVALARQGDGAVVETPDGDALGIVQGAGIYVLLPSGLALVPLTAARCALEVS